MYVGCWDVGERTPPPPSSVCRHQESLTTLQTFVVVFGDVFCQYKKPNKQIKMIYIYTFKNILSSFKWYKNVDNWPVGCWGTFAYLSPCLQKFDNCHTSSIYTCTLAALRKTTTLWLAKSEWIGVTDMLRKQYI